MLNQALTIVDCGTSIVYKVVGRLRTGNHGGSHGCREPEAQRMSGLSGDFGKFFEDDLLEVASRAERVKMLHHNLEIHIHLICTGEHVVLNCISLILVPHPSCYKLV